MTSAEFGRSMRQTDSLLRQVGILHHLQGLGSLPVDVTFRQLSGTAGTSYAELFRYGLEHMLYNFQLADLSYLQFYHGEGEILPEIRYAYYPNPYVTESYERFCDHYAGDLLDPDLYEMYLQSLEEAQFWDATPIVRYEVAGAQYQELRHPTAHLHFGLHKGNRWPVARILTPRAFACLIAKHFYGDEWGAHAAVAGEDMSWCDQAFIDEKGRCAELDAEFFSDNERRQVFMS